MSLRKIAGLLVVLGLVLGLVGGGVGAAFTDTLTATENINVGTFACQIVDATPKAASDGIALDGKSLTFAAPTIMSSAAGSALFSFTVKNTGSINQKLTITVGGPYGQLSNKFSAVALAPASPVALAAGVSQKFDAGIQWTELDSTDLGDAGSFTWTVTCGEVPPTVTIVKTQLGVGPTGWYGNSCPPATPHIVSASVSGASYFSLTLAKPGATVLDWNGVTTHTFPIFPHYTYGTWYAGEEGAAVQNDNDGPETQVLTIVCQP